ncbi:hypothetical protein PSAC2689_160119 [Paraburkholderia sacchari]
MSSPAHPNRLFRRHIKKPAANAGGLNSLIEKRQAPAQGGEAGSPAPGASLDRYDIPLS